MIGWLISGLSALASLGFKLWAYFSTSKHDALVQNAQAAKDAADNSTGGLRETALAKDAKDSIDASLARNPDSVRSSDGFNRQHATDK